MRKLIIATFIFIAIFAFAIFELKFISNKCSQLLNSTKQIKYLVALNDFDRAKNQLQLLRHNYLKDEKKLQMLLLHDKLDTIYKNLNQLEIALNLKNKNRAFEKIAKIESSYEKIMNDENITPQNIF